MSYLPDSAGPRIAAVVVTYNRAALLGEALAALLEQTRLPEAIVVIDNKSTDGTVDMLRDIGLLTGEVDIEASSPIRRDATIEQKGVPVLVHYMRLPENTGSSGGQHAGIKLAYESGYDWFWCMDDDTIPYPDALEKLTCCGKIDDPRTGALSSLVMWTDGTLHRMCMNTFAKGLDWITEIQQGCCVPVETMAFVGVLYRREAVQAVGLPVKDFFIWVDDVEYSERIGAKYNIYFVVDSKVLHKTPENLGSEPQNITPHNLFKYMHGWRNLFVYYKYREGWSPTFKVLKITQELFLRSGFVLSKGLPPALILTMVKGLLKKKVIEFPWENGASPDR